MLVLTGPSASGKTEIAKILINNHKLIKLVTYTTRPPRLGEVDGVDYHFISVAEFLKLKDKDEFIETTFYNNNYYGSRKKDVALNKVVVLDPSGLNQYYEALGNKLVSVFLETPKKVRIKRMIARGDQKEDIKKRIKNDRRVFKKSKMIKIDRIIINNLVDLDCITNDIYNYYQNKIKGGTNETFI